MIFKQLAINNTLQAALIAWLLAQFLKVPLEYLETHAWNWGLWFSAGGMPSSHSALMCAVALSSGLNDGFDKPAFAVALAVAMIVVYDAAGVRRQAGMQAKKINSILTELFSGQPISEQRLKEVLGHTPRQVVAGVLLGLTTAWVWWLLWRA